MKHLHLIIFLMSLLLNFYVLSQNSDSLQLNYRVYNDLSISYIEQNNKLQIRCPNDFIPYKIYVYNVTGTLIYSSKSVEYQLPIMEYYIELSKGIYVINIETKFKTISKKIIVNN
ncbi:MAG: T9SS type A sorting domain-containing protein [Bacteroidales bacterium]|nr:T9SS type A sorting domain-containing protein [Bacteroidales bacterium]